MGQQSDEVFTTLHVHAKWKIICAEMDYIAKAEEMFQLRRRLNPHHPIDDVRRETASFRVMQYDRWCKVKDLYAQCRDELADTCGDPKFEECKSLLERIFTDELDVALREVTK